METELNSIESLQQMKETAEMEIQSNIEKWQEIFLKAGFRLSNVKIFNRAPFLEPDDKYTVKLTIEI